MIIVKPVGGLASQLHKYAIGKALAFEHGVELKLDMDWFENTPEGDTAWGFKLDYFQVNYSKASKDDILKLKPCRSIQFLNRVLRKLFNMQLKVKSYSNKSFLSVDELFRLPSPLYIEGEFSGFEFFAKIKSILQNEVAYTCGRSVLLDSYVRKLKATDKPKVSIHFRRGDYLSNSNAAKFHYVCSDSYYLEAIKELETYVGEFDLIVFSDDIEWVEDNFPFSAKRNNIFVKELEDYEEFQLMSMCNHNIISNSGFSWFASWLNLGNNIIVAPTKWVTDSAVNQSILESITDENVVFVDK